MADVTMVERVARALCDAQGRSWGAADAESHDRWRDLARAAIAAMRAPTEAMIEAGSDFTESSAAEVAFIAMIDAALAEGEGG